VACGPFVVVLCGLGGLLGDVGRYYIFDEHRRKRLFRYAIKGSRDAIIVADLKQRRHLDEFLVGLQLWRSACASFAKERR
jgi:hypothetical protein